MWPRLSQTVGTLAYPLPLSDSIVIETSKASSSTVTNRGKETFTCTYLERTTLCVVAGVEQETLIKQMLRCFLHYEIFGMDKQYIIRGFVPNVMLLSLFGGEIICSLRLGFSNVAKFFLLLDIFNVYFYTVSEIWQICV